jgi:hypothetical protein
MNNELKRIWKEVIMASFEVLFQHLPGGTEKNHKKLQSGQPVPEPRLSPGSPKYEAGV